MAGSTGKGKYPFQSTWVKASDVINDDDFCDVDHPLKKAIQTWLFGAEAAYFTNAPNGYIVTTSSYGSIQLGYAYNPVSSASVTTSGSANCLYHNFAPNGYQVLVSSYGGVQLGYAYNPVSSASVTTSGFGSPYQLGYGN